MSARVVIVGGGIAGLTALEQLTRIAPTIDVVLLEAADRLGGHIRTEHSDGYVMEVGPDVILAAKPAALALASRVGLAERVQHTNPAAKGSYILGDRGLRRLPEGLTGLVPSRIGPFLSTPLLSPAAKLRVALDYVIRRRDDVGDESIESFVVRRLGRGMYERLVEPLLSGISAGDGSRLSMAATFPQLHAMEREHGGLLRAMLAQRRRTSSRRESNGSPSRGAASGFVSFLGGLGELPTAISAAVAARDIEPRRVLVRTGARVSRIERVRPAGDTAPARVSRFVVHLADESRMEASAVIVATPAFAAAEMLRGLDASLADLLAGIGYASTVTMSLAYPRAAVPRALDATGYIVPRALGRPVLACTWASAKFTGRAPGDRVLFRLFIGGAGRGAFVDADDAELRAVARAEMREIMGITMEPVLERMHRLPRAMPQYDVGHLDRVGRIDSALARVPGLALAGAAYRGVGIPDCVRSGERAAEDIFRELIAPAPSATGSLP